MSASIPAHIADLADVIVPPGHWNDTEVAPGADAGGWLLDTNGQLCAGNATDTEETSAVGPTMENNVYVQRRVFINVYLVNVYRRTLLDRHRRKSTSCNNAKITKKPLSVTHIVCVLNFH